MLSIQEADKVVTTAYPTGTIQKVVEYEDLFVYQIFGPMPGEETHAPFFSVNRKTGEFRDFSIFDDGDTQVLDDLFIKAKRR